jgi:DnaJ-class molecular chaperone
MNQADLPVAKLPPGPRWYLCKACAGTGNATREATSDKPSATTLRRGDCHNCAGVGEVLETRR